MTARSFAIGARTSACLKLLEEALDEEFECFRVQMGGAPEIEVVGAMLPVLRSNVNLLLARFAGKFSGNAGTIGLPDEVLCCIFRHLPLSDCIVATHVCRSWRAVALSFASLWNNIRSMYQSPGVLTARLSRVPRGSPFHLSVRIMEDRYEEVIHILDTRWNDILSLYLHITGSFLRPSPWEAQRFAAVLSRHAPLLKRFSLETGNAHWALGRLGHPVLSAGAPRLRTVRFCGLTEGLDRWVLGQQVTSLVLLAEAWFTPEHVHGLFTTFTNLVSLVIFLPIMDEWFVGGHLRLVPPSTLTKLAFGMRERTVDILPVIRHVVHSVVPVCGLFFSPSASAPDTMAHISLILSKTPGDVETAVLTCRGYPPAFDSGLILLDLDVFTSSNPSRRLGFVRANIGLYGVELHWSSTLRYLTITENLLAPILPAHYDFPCLTSLCIVFLAPSRVAEDSYGSIFLSVDDNPLVICHALVDFSLALSQEHKSLGISERVGAHTLIRFLNSHVDSAEPVAVYLRDITLDTSNLGAVADLLTLVRDIVEVDDSDARGWQPCHGAEDQPFKGLVSLEHDIDDF